MQLSCTMLATQKCKMHDELTTLETFCGFFSEHCVGSLMMELWHKACRNWSILACDVENNQDRIRIVFWHWDATYDTKGNSWWNWYDLKSICKANSRYMGAKFDPSKPPKCISHKDTNNLFGWAMTMSKTLPTNSFSWMSKAELDNWENYPCYLEVEL